MAITTPSAMMSAPQSISTKPKARITLPAPLSGVLPRLIHAFFVGRESATGLTAMAAGAIILAGGLAAVTAIGYANIAGLHINGEVFAAMSLSLLVGASWLLGL